MSSHLSLEATEVVGNEWTEACVTLTSDDGTEQDLFLNPMEMQTLYARLKLFYEQGVWSMGTVHDAS